MSTIYTKEGDQEYSPEAVAALKGARYAVVQPSQGNKMGVMLVGANGLCEWDHFGGPGRTKKAISEARSWVGL